MTAATPARERVLDAFEELLIDNGERSATLDAVAAGAGVSKGGLLYHFGSKDALASGLVDRLDARRDSEIAGIAAADEGAVAFLLRSSLDAGTPFDRTILAVARLAQGAHPLATDALSRLHDSWFDVILAEVGDPVAARAIVLISDGLYYNSALLPTDSAVATLAGDGAAGLDDLIALAHSFAALRRSAG